MVINATIEAFFAVWFLSAVFNEDVIVMNTGIVPNGFKRVKNDVNANKMKLTSSFNGKKLFGEIDSIKILKKA
jgi:hypothetical protein